MQFTVIVHTSFPKELKACVFRTGLVIKAGPTMQTTSVAVAGKGSNPKTTLYVGGLEESVNEAILHSAFIPFGEIKDVSIPLDHASGKHRGFGFVEFEDKEDTADAIDNMHNAGVLNHQGQLRAAHCKGASLVITANFSYAWC